MKNTTKAHLALLFTNLFYGISFTAAKQVMPRLIQPTAFILIRVGVALILFWMSWFLGKKYRDKIDRKDFPRLIICGIFGVGLNQMLFFEGLSQTYPIHASLIMMSTPLLITIFSFVVFREKLRWDKGLGFILGVSGAIFLMAAGKEITAFGSTAKGDLLVFLNAASYAVYLIAVKPLMRKYRPIIVIRWVFLFGFLLVLPFGWEHLNQVQWARFTPEDFAVVGFVVFFVTFLTYLWNVYALRYLSPGVTGAYIYLQPVFAALISVALYGESITWVKLLASMLVFSGVYLVSVGFPGKKLPGTRISD